MQPLTATTVTVADITHSPIALRSVPNAATGTQPTVIFSDDLFQALNLTANTPIELIQYPDGRIELKPFINNMHKLKGIAKFDSHTVLSVEEMNDIIAQAGADSAK